MSDIFELSVSGMNCMHCAGAVTRAVEAVEGTSHVMVSLESAKVTFEADAPEVREMVRNAIQAAGYSTGV